MMRLSVLSKLVLAVAILAGIPQGEAQYGREEQFDPDEVGGFEAGPLRDDIVPGQFLLDPPTLQNLGFRWYVQGDSNRNATVAVSYRRQGEAKWQEAQPMLRVHHEIVNRFVRDGRHHHYRTGNLFAGSVMFLRPGTQYEIRFVMSDPDGGAPAEAKVVTALTRGEPQAWEKARTLHVYPSDFQGSRVTADACDSITAAYEMARPGDIIYLHAGVHRAAETRPGPPLEVPEGRTLGSRTPPAAEYTFAKSGKPGKPIVLRGAGAERTIIEGRDHKTDLFRIAEADHLMFEDLTLRRAHTAIRGGSSRGAGASWLTVRRCRFEDVINGVWTYSPHSQNWYIADNVFTGTDQQWHPRTLPERGYMDGSHTGVNVYGQGHVVCHNQISRFSDSVAVANFNRPSPTELDRHAVNIDFYNNDLSFAADDTMEADYGCHNIRVYRNLNYNAHTALSAQPTYGGPIYLIRNLAYGITSLSWKWNNHPTGLIAYHNTTISGGTAFSSPAWSNGHLRNNLMLGNGGKISSGTLTPESTTIDFNGYHGSVIRWSHGYDERRDYGSLAAFAAATGYEKNGIQVDFDDFVTAPPVERGKTYHLSEFDLRLRPGAKPVESGVRLANINDHHSGEAPDLGALELGQPLPHYGPRSTSVP